MNVVTERERGSTIPLIIGIFVIALFMVGGSIAAGDAFVQQSGLQSVCDGAAVAAASSADPDSNRDGNAQKAQKFLELSQVQQAVAQYLSRDPARMDVQMQASLSPDQTVVGVACVVREPLAFGAMFGLSGGVVHHATASARAPLTAN